MTQKSPDEARTRELMTMAREVWRGLRDPRVPVWQKAIPILGAVYLLAPIDLIPDFAPPLIGQLDDIAILLIAMRLFLNVIPRDRVGAETGKAPSGPEEPLEATYRVREES